MDFIFFLFVPDSVEQEFSSSGVAQRGLSHQKAGRTLIGPLQCDGKRVYAVIFQIC